MDHKQDQNPAELTPDEQLDLLLEKFLAEDMEPGATVMPEIEPEVAAEVAAPVTEEAELPAEPVPEETPVEATPLAEESFEDLLIGEPMAAPETINADAAAPELDDLELEAILRAAFSDISSAGEPDDSDSLANKTIMMDRISDVPESEAATDEESGQALEEDTDAYDDEESEAEETAETKKRRPKDPHAYGFFGIPHMVSTVIWLVLVIFIGASLGRMIWQVAADMLAFGRESQSVTITIVEGDDLDDITDKLYDMGLIRYKSVFKFYGGLAKAEQKIKPGTYHLNSIYDYNALVKKMSGYEARATTTVVIPEGYSCAQIFQLLEEKGVCSAAKLQDAAMNADLSKYWFLEGVDRSDPNCLEGYLFPDTYDFYLDYEADNVLGKLLNTFNLRFSETMQGKLNALNLTLADMMRSHGLSDSYIQEHQITIRELVIIASMIEKETSGDTESYYIASVIYNRLTNPGEFPYLNIDAALVYAVGHSPLTKEDLEFDSPYNTYLYKGLIPGPIANPGMASLNAALFPESTEYYYYALDPSTGEHQFFKTYKEHQKFLESLQNGDE